MKLSESIKIKRRYSRSVNLDRDLEHANSLSGYVLTPKNANIIDRILESLKNPSAPKSWTITGLYGTGKSAFAEFLVGLISPTGSELNKSAINIAKHYDLLDGSTYRGFRRIIGRRGIVIASSVSQREPLKSVVFKALKNGVNSFWSAIPGAKPNVLSRLDKALSKLDKGVNPSNDLVLSLIQDIAEASKSGLIIVIDELGKVLEYSANNPSEKDLFLLQQIAELPSNNNGTFISFIGILHQSFADYSASLNQTERNEWAKIQGRFEDISFSEVHEYTMRILADIIESTFSKSIMATIAKDADIWSTLLSKPPMNLPVDKELIKNSYPLHPISLVVLPLLCEKFAQNERSLFSFMTSNEPNSFARFIDSEAFSNDKLPTLKLHHVYDYFIESAGFIAIHNKTFQRWVEIQDILNDFRSLGTDVQSLIKTIGIFNLISQTGVLSARKKLIILSLCDSPNNKDEYAKWNGLLDNLIERGLINYRTQNNEIRLWEGTDFNIEGSIAKFRNNINEPIEDFLNSDFALDPLIAHRHSYEKGTLRYFKRKYIGNKYDRSENCIRNENFDGTVFYYIGHKELDDIISQSNDLDKPCIFIKINHVDALRQAALDYIALKKVEKKSPELKTDGVARKEIRQRLTLAKKIFESTLQQSISPSYKNIEYFYNGKLGILKTPSDLSELLSISCDEYYSKTPVLWNELINRNQITSQISKARRQLIDSMLSDEGKEDLNIKGFGPEKTIFNSVLLNSGIYSHHEDRWVFKAPGKKSGLYHTWKAIENLCCNAKTKPMPILEIYNTLKESPYGVREGIIPIVFLAVLLNNSDNMSLYVDNSFIPVVGAEHFELLVKRPEKFAIKYFDLKGLKLELFRDMATLFDVKENNNSPGLRNDTLLGIIKPLIRFIKSLPRYTLNTTLIEKEPLSVRDALLKAHEPDLLLFNELPVACGLKPVNSATEADKKYIESFKSTLVQSLRALNLAYDELLKRCRESMATAFSIDPEMENFREHLRVRSSYLLGSCIEPRLRGFLKSATEKNNDNQKWLESLIMIIADKPASSWTDNDEEFFEANVNDFARRFSNLEALYKEFDRIPNKGFEARRVVFTKPDGSEDTRVLWIDKEKQIKIESIAEDILSNYKLEKNTHEFQSFLAELLERFFHREEKEERTSERTVAVNEKAN